MNGFDSSGAPELSDSYDLLGSLFPRQNVSSTEGQTGHASPFYYANTLLPTEEQLSSWEENLGAMNSNFATLPILNDELYLGPPQDNFYDSFNPILQQQNTYTNSLPVGDHGIYAGSHFNLGLDGGLNHDFNPASVDLSMPTAEQNLQLDFYNPEQEFSIAGSSFHPSANQVPIPNHNIPGLIPLLGPHEYTPVADPLLSQPSQPTFDGFDPINENLFSVNTDFSMQMGVPLMLDTTLDFNINQSSGEDTQLYNNLLGPKPMNTGINPGMGDVSVVRPPDSHSAGTLSTTPSSKKLHNKFDVKKVASRVTKRANDQFVLKTQIKRAGTLQTRHAISSMRPSRRLLSLSEKKHKKAIRDMKACLPCACSGKCCQKIRPCERCSHKYSNWGWVPCDAENIMSMPVGFVTRDTNAFQYLFYSDPNGSMVEEDVDGYSRLLKHNRSIFQLVLANPRSPSLAIRLLELEGEVLKPHISTFLEVSEDVNFINFEMKALLMYKTWNIHIPSNENENEWLLVCKKLLRCCYVFTTQRELEGAALVKLAGGYLACCWNLLIHLLKINILQKSHDLESLHKILIAQELRISLVRMTSLVAILGNFTANYMKSVLSSPARKTEHLPSIAISFILLAFGWDVLSSFSEFTLISPDTDLLYQTARKHLAVYVISCSGLKSLFTAKPQDDKTRESFDLARDCYVLAMEFCLQDPLDDGAILFLKSLLMTSNPDFHGTNPLLTSKSRTDKIPEAS